MRNTRLTYEWQPIGDIYEKLIQDVRLHNGDIFRGCYLNAGSFMQILGGKKEVPWKDVADVRLSFHPKANIINPTEPPTYEE